MSKLFPLVLCLLGSALALAACGGGSGGGSEESQVEEVIETSATSTDPADCTRLDTQRFMTQIAQEGGAAAVKECEEEAEGEEGAKSAKISKLEVDHSSARAEVTLTGGALDGQAVEVVLLKAGEEWKMYEISRFTKVDQGRLAEAFAERAAQHRNELSPKLAACFTEAFETASRARVEELLLSGSTDALEEVAEECPAA